MDSGWIMAVAICIPMTKDVMTIPTPTVSDRWDLLGGSSARDRPEPQTLDTSDATTETSAQPTSTGTGDHGIPANGNISARNPMVPTLNAGATRRAGTPRIRTAIAVAKPGSNSSITVVRTTGKDCHQDTEHHSREIRDGY